MKNHNGVYGLIYFLNYVTINRCDVTILILQSTRNNNMNDTYINIIKMYFTKFTWKSLVSFSVIFDRMHHLSSNIVPIPNIQLSSDTFTLHRFKKFPTFLFISYKCNYQDENNLENNSFKYSTMRFLARLHYA